MLIYESSVYLATSDSRITVYDRSTHELEVMGEIICHEGVIDCLCIVKKE